MKKYILPFLLMAVLPFALLSCKKNNSGTDELSYVYLNTAAAEDVTPISANLMADVKFHNFTASGTMGLKFYYCQSDTPIDRYDIVDMGEITPVQTLDIRDGHFGCVVEGLLPGKDYYFMPHLSVMGVSLVSEVKHFTTQDFCVTVEVKDTTSAGATIHAMAVLSAEQKAMAKLGFQWTSEDFDGGETHDAYLETTALDDKGNFSYAITGLTANTVYYVRAFVSLDGRRHYANIRNFKTKAE